MYAAVPRIMPACVIAGVVMVGDCDMLGDDARPAPIALASPKSSTLTVPSGAHLDIGGLEIAMDDPLLVRRLERFGDLPGDRQGFVERQSGPRAMRSASVGPSTSSITSARTPLGFLETVDVRRCSGGSAPRALRFAREPRQPIGITARRRREGP